MSTKRITLPALVLVEIIIILSLLLAMNMFIFRRISVSFSGVIFMFHIAARSGFRMISFKVIAFLFVVVVFFTVQLVFMYQAVRKAVLDFRNRNRHSSGTARWSSTRELKKLGLIIKEPDGVILGQSKDAKGVITGSDSFRITRFGSLISDNSAYHAIVVGATGSGKGVGVIMPTLLTWKESVMIVDPKGESYGYTAGYRSTFSEVFYFDPTMTAEEARERHIKPCHINILVILVLLPIETDYQYRVWHTYYKTADMASFISASTAIALFLISEGTKACPLLIVQ